MRLSSLKCSNKVYFLNQYKRKKWVFFNNIYFLRKNGIYNNFSFYLEKIFNYNFNSYFFYKEGGELDYIINYFDNFFFLMKELRYVFLSLFLKQSKKLKKIRLYLKSKKIIEHPCIINFLNPHDSFFVSLPIPICKISFILFKKWVFFNYSLSYKLRKLEKSIYLTRFNKIHLWIYNYKFLMLNNEVDYLCGDFLQIKFKMFSINNELFWPLFAKILYWRLYAM